MAAFMPTVHNNNVCVYCKKTSNDGLIKNNKFYCSNLCDIQDNMVRLHSLFPPTHSISAAASAPAPFAQPTTAKRLGGTCAHCHNNYTCLPNSVDDGENWYCRKACQDSHKRSNRMFVPVNFCPFPFNPNMRTILPTYIKATATSFRMDY